MYTNLVMGQIASRLHHSDKFDGDSSTTSRAAYEPGHRQSKTKSTHFADDTNSQRRESDDRLSKDIPYIDRSSDIETKSQDVRKRFPSTDNASDGHKVHLDSRTDDTQL